MGLSLLGWPLLVVLLVGALVTSIVAVVGAPRRGVVAGRPALRTAVRATALILSQVMVVGIVADVINRQNGFYVSWGDLFGTSTITSVAYKPAKTANFTIPTESAVVRRHGGHFHATSASLWPTNIAKYWPKGAVVGTDSRGFTRVSLTLTGAASHITGSVSIFLPPHWSPNPLKAYPMVEILGGFPGSSYIAFAKGGVGKVFEQYVAKHQFAPTVFVAVQNYSVRDSECINSSAGQWGTWLAVDVPNYVVRHAAVSPNRVAHAALGFSMGGWCANMLAVKYSQTFGSSVSLGGYMKPTFDPPSPVKLTAAQASSYDLNAILLSQPPNIHMWMQTDSLDPISYPSTAPLTSHAVPAPASVTLYVTKGAGHNWRTVGYSLPIAAKWLSRTSPVFAGSLATP